MMFVHTISNLFQLSNEQQIGPRTDDKRVHVQRPVATLILTISYIFSYQMKQEPKQREFLSQMKPRPKQWPRQMKS